MKEDFRTCHCSRANKLAGVGALAAIIWLIISRSFVGKLIGLHMYVGLLYLLLTASCLAVLISFLGWFGASNRVKWMLYLYGGILSVIFLIVFVASMLGLLIRERTAKMIQNTLLYTINLYTNKPIIRQAWDEIQPYFKCCGVKSYEDWNKNIPQSCCRIIKFQLDPQCNVTSFPPTAIYKDGCYALMVHFVSTHLVYICIFGLATGFLELKTLDIKEPSKCLHETVCWINKISL
ncbi:tetraspanin-4-like isoform X2 [Hetaerina americana]|uniref:tetraspanin-4-like isoform X2 n=1 Tax=Hetaerina americana TaxID=62018 RepID=UPI003A7F1AA5